MKPFIAAILFVMATIACLQIGAGAKPIPEPFHKQMADLQHRNTQIDMQMQDLQQQIAVLCAEEQRNNQRIQSLATQAIHESGGPTNAFVDLNNLTIKPQPQ